MTSVEPVGWSISPLMGDRIGGTDGTGVAEDGTGVATAEGAADGPPKGVAVVAAVCTGGWLGAAADAGDPVHPTTSAAKNNADMAAGARTDEVAEGCGMAARTSVAAARFPVLGSAFARVHSAPLPEQ